MVRAVETEQGGPDVAPGTPRPGPRRLGALLRTARPRQWTKNLLVFAAPGAAGVLSHGHDVVRATATFGIFCLVASGTYFVNDTLDAASDRNHPTKRRRPVAAGELTAATASVVGGLAQAAAVGLAWWLSGWRLALVIGVYVALSMGYSLGLKHVPVIDLGCVSSGFVVRAIAGGVATGVALSDWFLIVTSFGSLLVVAGKRSAEHADRGDDRASTRRALAFYPPAFLRSVRLVAASITLTAYCLWAFERAGQANGAHHPHPLWFELSILPVVLAVLHLELRFESGQGEAPEELALHDRMLQSLGLVWVALFALGVYT